MDRHAIAEGKRRPEDRSAANGRFVVRHKPELTRLLEFLGLNVDYQQGSGSRLFYRRDSDPRDSDPRDASSECSLSRWTEVLDLVGGYGSLLLGHNHPELLAEARAFWERGRPTFTQGSGSVDAERLAGELSHRAGGDYRVVFGNSGAEAVEAALKHAMLETGGRRFVTLRGAFHGKTLATVQLCDNPFYRSEFRLDGPSSVSIAVNDLSALRRAFRDHRDLAGMIFEPILGEGGVRPLEGEFLRLAARLCREYGVPLIADECQTGVGRTGRFLACQWHDVPPDYVVLAKSLGGGLAKISATLIRRDRYRDVFDTKHSSTFAADGFSCRIALRTLELLDDRLLVGIERQGAELLEDLRRLASNFPDVIADVRGRGLLLGLELRDRNRSPNFLMRGLSCRQLLGHAVAAYLFHSHDIRVAPTLSDPLTIRIQPGVTTDRMQWWSFFDAMEDVCSVLACDDAVELTRFLTERKSPLRFSTPLAAGSSWFAFDESRFAREEAHDRRTNVRQTNDPQTRVAWLCHLIDPLSLSEHDRSLRRLPIDGQETYLERLSPLAAPVALNPVTVRSSVGRCVRLFPIMLPLTSAAMRRRLYGGEAGFCRRLIEQAVGLASDFGCSVTALGQYTSVVTRGGRSVRNERVGLTNGNALAVALAIQAVEKSMRERGLDERTATLAVVGATGNIGSVITEILAPRFARCLCFTSSRNASRRRLERISSDVPGCRAEENLRSLREADVVLAAVNAVTPPIEPEMLAPHAIVCDLSVPAAVPPDLSERSGATVIRGGIVRLPGGEDLGIPSFPLPAGQAYACLAEGVLLGLEGYGAGDRRFVGRLSRGHVESVARIARAHGFELAECKSHCVLGSTPKEWEHGCRR